MQDFSANEPLINTDSSHSELGLRDLNWGSESSYGSFLDKEKRLEA